MRGVLSQVKINGFSEQDQENLYMATHLGKTSGKKGLGRSTQPKDIGGVKWAGKKTLLEDTEAHSGDECGNGARAVTDDRCTAQAAEARTASAADPADTAEPSASGIKWKKRAKQLLSGAPAGKMKLKKLQKQLLQESQCPQTSWDVLGSQMMAQLASSKQFKLTQTHVILVQ